MQGSHAVHITADGEAVLRTGSFSHGQGHETTFAMIVAERLGLPMEAVAVIKGDTDQVARGTGTYGSKSTQIGGAAAGQASEEVVEKARRLVPSQLGVRLHDCKAGATWTQAFRGVFIHVGLEPNTAFLRGLIALDAAGHIETDMLMRTSLAGVFAAGDIRKHSVAQLAAAAGDGATAAISAVRYLQGRT